MKATLEKVLASVAACNKLMELKLPAVKAFRIIRILKQLNVVLEDFNETKQLIQTRLQEDKDIDKAEKELQELLKKEVEILGEPLGEEFFGGMEVEVGALFGIEWLIYGRVT